MEIYVSFSSKIKDFSGIFLVSLHLEGEFQENFVKFLIPFSIIIIFQIYSYIMPITLKLK